ncbi:competence/damage-inducible protein A [Chloroflexota bacterium]
MRAEIISVGTEILLGEITDTNASFLASQLPSLGIDLYWVSQVGDNQARLVEVLRRAWQRSDLILVTGGLGPTEDDLTREAIAEMLGEEIRVEPALESEIREFFARRNIEMPQSNVKQATLIPSAEAIHNIQGTAPGWWVEREGHTLVAMPGPPGEMQSLWHREILPRICPRFSEAIIFSKTFKIFGLTEAGVGEMVSPLLSSANPTLGVYAKVDGIHLRLTAKAQDRKQAEGMIAQGEASIRAIVGEYIWGTDDDTLEAVAGHVLTGKGLTLAVMESCTGGLLAATITDASGASSYFKGGLVAYSNEMKIDYGVASALIAEHGAVNPEVAQAMAEAARSRLAADVGIGITGVAGPDKLEDKPAGVVYIAVSDGKNVRASKGHYPGDRARVRRRAVTAALFELIKMLATID